MTCQYINASKFRLPKCFSANSVNIKHRLSVDTLQAAWGCTLSKTVCLTHCITLIQDYAAVASYGVAKGIEKKTYVCKLTFEFRPYQ